MSTPPVLGRVPEWGQVTVAGTAVAGTGAGPGTLQNGFVSQKHLFPAQDVGDFVSGIIGEDHHSRGLNAMAAPAESGELLVDDALHSAIRGAS